MTRSTIPAEDCTLRLDSDYKYNQASPMTFTDVAIIDDTFSGGSIAAHLSEVPVFIEVQYDDSHVVVAWASVPACVTYSDSTLTVDCSANTVKRVSAYSRTLDAQEIQDVIDDATFQFRNETPTTTQQAHIDWQDGLKLGRN